MTRSVAIAGVVAVAFAVAACGSGGASGPDTDAATGSVAGEGGDEAALVQDAAADATSEAPIDAPAAFDGGADAGPCPPLQSAGCNGPCPSSYAEIPSMCVDAGGSGWTESLDPCDGLTVVTLVTGIDSELIYYFDSTSKALVGVAGGANNIVCLGGAPGFRMPAGCAGWTDIWGGSSDASCLGTGDGAAGDAPAGDAASGDARAE